MQRFKIYTGKDLSEEMYLKTWELDNRTFEDKDKISKELALEWFECSGRSTIVLFDEKEKCLVGYITPFLLNHKFAKDYIISNKNYKKAIKPSTFCELEKDKEGDIYLFSVVVEERYRNKKLEDSSENSIFDGKAAIQILTEAFLDWCCDIKERGISINYVFSEKVSDDGEKYLKSLGLQLCFNLSDDAKFAKLFSPSIFSKCSNKSRLLKLYQKESMGFPFDKHLLDGHEYLSIKNGELFYEDINLHELVKKYEAPLEVAYTPMITKKIEYLKNLFNQKIEKYGYPAKYNYAYATKANYYSEVVLTALNSVHMLETSSAYDINLIIELAKKKYIKKGFTVICNGFKNQKYISAIRELLKMEINVIPVIENEQEFELLQEIKDFNINVGLRYNSDFESRLIKNNFKKEEFDNRFGFNEEQIEKIANKIAKTDNMTLKVFHFHFGGTITNINNYIKGFANIFNVFAKLKKKHKAIEYFDFGGGFPTKYSLAYSFDFDLLVDSIVKTVHELSIKNKIEPPHLIGEHGRFTTADHSFYIYKIDFTKENNLKHWYIINGSLMNMAPDMWGIQQDFTILPVNLLNNKCVPVCLGGETCDPDDRYYLQDSNVELFMPKIKPGETLYVAIFSIGAYQEIISGIGGVHHCLIPEGNELIIYKNNGKTEYYQPKLVDEKKKAIDILDYDDEKYMKKFFKK